MASLASWAAYRSVATTAAIGFALVANPIVRENRVVGSGHMRRIGGLKQAGRVGFVDVGDGVHSHHVLTGFGRGRVDPLDPGVGVAAAMERQMDRPGVLDVVGVLGVARDQCAVLAALDRRAKEALSLPFDPIGIARFDAHVHRPPSSIVRAPAVGVGRTIGPVTASGPFAGDPLAFRVPLCTIVPPIARQGQSVCHARRTRNDRGTTAGERGTNTRGVRGRARSNGSERVRAGRAVHVDAMKNATKVLFGGGRTARMDEVGAGHDTMLWRPAAVAAVSDLRETALADRGAETVALNELSGRVLAGSIVASGDRPARDRATMDGFAFDASRDYPFDVVADVFPEDDPPSIETGEAVAIATGAPLPEDANAVLKREDAALEDGRLRGAEIEPGTYVYRQGSNVTAGETLFEHGERLSPKDAIFLRDLGVDSPTVYERFRTAVLATGTEIHEGRQDDFDSAMLCGLVDSWGGEATYEGTVPDENEVVTDRIAALADRYDVVLTTGGTSVGKKDYVIRALADLGDVRFHRVRIRPGKPIAAAHLPDHDAVAFAIPGKPVGAHTVAMLVVRPFFVGSGTLTPTPLPTIEATLARDIDIGAAGFEYVVPVTLQDGGDARSDGGDVEAMPLGHVDSPLSVFESQFDPSVLSSSTRATRADGVFVTEAAVERGEPVSVIPYDVLE